MKLILATIAVFSSLVALGQNEDDIPSCPICPWNIYLPDANCSRFWQCANGEATLKECPCDLHFRPEADVCDWMWNFKHDVPCKKWTNDDLVCKAPETTSTKSVTLDPSNPPPCPEHCPYLLHVPDATCCHNFWECEQGRAYKLRCPDGLVFDPEAKVCNFDTDRVKTRGWTYEDLICQDIIITTQKPCHCNENHTKPPGAPDCPAGCPDQLLVPDPNCTHWWDCTNGVATKMTCPSGLWWDSIGKICNYPKLAYCDTNGWTDKELECPSSTATNTTSTVTSTTSKTTSTTSKTTSTTSKTTSTTSKITSTTSKTTSTTSPTNLPECKVGVKFLKNPLDCRSYYQCTNGEAILMSCPEGLYWNSKGNYCDWPQISGCKQPT